MRTRRTLPLLITTILLTADIAFATKVHKKDGTVVEGKLQGLIAQKGTVGVLDACVSRDSKSLEATYVITNGSGIDLIDNRGVHATEYRIMAAVCATKEFEDLKVITKVLTANAGGTMMTRLDEDASMIIFNPPPTNSRPTSKETFPRSDDHGLSNSQVIVENLSQAFSDNGAIKFPLLGEILKVGKAFQIVPTVRVKTKDTMMVIPVEEIVQIQ